MKYITMACATIAFTFSAGTSLDKGQPCLALVFILFIAIILVSGLICAIKGK